MSFFNWLLYISISLYAIALLVLVFRNIFIEALNNHNSVEPIVRGGMFLAGMLSFLIAFAFGINIKDLINRSFTEIHNFSDYPFILSFLCVTSGALSSYAILTALKKEDSSGVRMVLLLMGMLISAIAYTYTISFESSSPEGAIKTELIPSMLFIFGSLLYLGLKYPNPKNDESQITNKAKEATQIRYGNAYTTCPGEVLEDSFTGSVFELDEIRYSSPYWYVEGRITLSEEPWSVKKPISLKEGDSIGFTVRKKKYHFSVEKVRYKDKKADFRILQL